MKEKQSASLPPPRACCISRLPRHGAAGAHGILKRRSTAKTGRRRRGGGVAVTTRQTHRQKVALISGASAGLPRFCCAYRIMRRAAYLAPYRAGTFLCWRFCAAYPRVPACCLAPRIARSGTLCFRASGTLHISSSNVLTRFIALSASDISAAGVNKCLQLASQHPHPAEAL